MSNVVWVLPIALSALLVSCGGGSSGGATQTNQGSAGGTGEQTDPQQGAQQGAGQGTGQALVAGIEIEPFQTYNGIEVDITGYSLSAFNQPQIALQLNNTSAMPIYNASCTVTALQDNVIVDVANAFFANLDPIDANESGADVGTWFDLKNGFSGFNKMRVECNWLDGDNGRIDLSNVAVQIDFTGYSTSSLGKPTAMLLLTNNSADTIFNARCGIEAKRGKLIVDVASAIFADGNDIRSGEAAESSAQWFDLSSFGDFDSEPFIPDTMNCNYLVR